jgi:hypothetical protein
MKIFTLSLIALSSFTLSAFAGNRYQEDGISFQEYLRIQEVQDRLDEINARLEALDDIQAQLNDIDNP